MKKNSPHKLLSALAGKNTGHPPVWLMRQAGRYLPEYQKIRAQVPDFMSLCKQSELACEVSLQPLKRYALDAAIVFSDILTIPDAMGMPVTFSPGIGPKFAYKIKTMADINQLHTPNIEHDLGYVCKTIQLLKQALQDQHPIIGFSGSPWTLACYMLSGGSSKDFLDIRKVRYTQPELLTRLLSKLTDIISDYVIAQATHGADVIMLFDSWGGLLTHADYSQFSLNYMQTIINKLKAAHPNIPSIIFTKGGGLWLSEIAQSGCQGIGIDWQISLAQARQRVDPNIALQGNLDPSLLFADKKIIKNAVNTMLSSHRSNHNYIANLGHGILPETPIDSIHYFIEAIHEYNTSYQTTN